LILISNSVCLSLPSAPGEPKAILRANFIEGNIEDLEDRYLAEQAIAEGGSRLTSDQVRKAFGRDG
jgi:predicted DNA-binding protein